MLTGLILFFTGFLTWMAVDMWIERKVTQLLDHVRREKGE